jgi:hypothetical protein
MPPRCSCHLRSFFKAGHALALENATRVWRTCAKVDYASQGNRTFLPLIGGLLAGIEVESHGVEGALTRVDEALALAAETEEHWTDSFLHRTRGKILVKRNTADTGHAAEAFLTAVGIAQQQKAKSFELQAALSLADLYQSTGRLADAHVILAAALEGFAPTIDFPEIAEAQWLLAVLAESAEVKKAMAARQRRLKLQISYGKAMMWSKGYGAEETKAAFARARNIGAGIGNFAERSAANYGHWVNNNMRCEFKLARETAENFLHEAENESQLLEVSIARRMLGYTCLFVGNFTESRAHFEEALR